MRIYYLQSEYETGKHKIVKCWTDKFGEALPEDSPKTAINDPYSVIEIDEEYNRVLCQELLSNTMLIPNGVRYDKFYVGSNGKIYDKDGNIQIINNNSHKETYKQSVIYNITSDQIDAYIDSHVTNITTAKDFLKKLARVVVLLARQNKFE